MSLRNIYSQNSSEIKNSEDSGGHGSFSNLKTKIKTTLSGSSRGVGSKRRSSSVKSATSDTATNDNNSSSPGRGSAAAAPPPSSSVSSYTRDILAQRLSFSQQQQKKSSPSSNNNTSGSFSYSKNNVDATTSNYCKLNELERITIPKLEQTIVEKDRVIEFLSDKLASYDKGMTQLLVQERDRQIARLQQQLAERRSRDDEADFREEEMRHIKRLARKKIYEMQDECKARMEALERRHLKQLQTLERSIDSLEKKVRKHDHEFHEMEKYNQRLLQENEALKLSIKVMREQLVVAQQQSSSSITMNDDVDNKEQQHKINNGSHSSFSVSMNEEEADVLDALADLEEMVGGRRDKYHQDTTNEVVQNNDQQQQQKQPPSTNQEQTKTKTAADSGSGPPEKKEEDEYDREADEAIKRKSAEILRNELQSLGLEPSSREDDDDVEEEVEGAVLKEGNKPRDEDYFESSLNGFVLNSLRELELIENGLL